MEFITDKQPKLTIEMSTIVVTDYDTAIEYFVDKLGFKLIEDSRIDSDKRWVVVAPSEQASHKLLLAKAKTSEQSNSIGKQAAGRVAFFLNTNDFETTYSRFKNEDVKFLEEPRVESYGKVVVFEDICGNRWDLIEHRLHR